MLGSVSVGVCVCCFFFWTRVYHQTRQAMMLSAAEDMRATIYNSTLSQLRHTVLPRGTGAWSCVCIILAIWGFLCVCTGEGDCGLDRQGWGQSAVNHRLCVCVRGTHVCLRGCCELKVRVERRDMSHLTRVKWESMMVCFLMSRIANRPN